MYINCFSPTRKGKPILNISEQRDADEFHDDWHCWHYVSHMPKWISVQAFLRLTEYHHQDTDWARLLWAKIKDYSHMWKLAFLYAVMETSAELVFKALFPNDEGKY